MHDMKQVVQRSPAILRGTPVFAGTRVPIQTLLDYLEAGDRLDDFLEQFPTVSRQQAVAGWAGKANGELLTLAHGEFEVLVTVDRNLAFQQNLDNLRIAVIVL